MFPKKCSGLLQQKLVDRISLHCLYVVEFQVDNVTFLRAFFMLWNLKKNLIPTGNLKSFCCWGRGTQDHQKQPWLSILNRHSCKKAVVCFYCVVNSSSLLVCFYCSVVRGKVNRNPYKGGLPYELKQNLRSTENNCRTLRQ